MSSCRVEESDVVLPAGDICPKLELLWMLLGRLSDPVEAIRTRRPLTPAFLESCGDDEGNEEPGVGEG